MKEFEKLKYEIDLISKGEHNQEFTGVYQRLTELHQALQLQQTGVMRSALNQEEAFKMFTEHNKYDGFIQWKGTDVCMDFHCECGHHNHYDDYFAYVIKCSECGNLYAPSSNVEMIRVKESDSFIESDH